MWVFLPDSFLAVSEHALDPRWLAIRARFPGDIERVFPTATVTETREADYRFRTLVPREEVAEVIAAKVRRINYPALTAEIAELGDRRPDVYAEAWDVLRRAQAAELSRRRR